MDDELFLIKWHDAKKELPRDNGRYLVVHAAFGAKNYKLLDYSKDLYSVDAYQFSSMRWKSGFYAYDAEYGYFEFHDVLKWAELPKIE